LKMKVIGLTGGIGTGKSTVSGFLADLGAVVIDADVIGHQLLEADSEVGKELVAAFGDGILTPKGDISRKKLAGEAFKDPESLAKLNRIMHPRMRAILKAKIKECREQDAEVVVLEAAVLLEADWDKLVDKIWVTMASRPTVLRRVKEKLGLSEGQALARIRRQLLTEDRASHADVLIDTDCPLGRLRAKVQVLWRQLGDSRRLTPRWGKR